MIMANIVDHSVDHRTLAFANNYSIAPKSSGNSPVPPWESGMFSSKVESGIPTDKREMAASRTVRISGMPSRRHVR